MPPKVPGQPGRRFEPPPPPPEKNPLDDLPEDVRALEECPFPVEWQPVVSILQFQSPEIAGLALRDTLLRKEKIRVVQVYDLVLRLDPASQLCQNVRLEMEAHLATGAPLEAFIPSPAYAAEVLEQRFQRDKCADWKAELVRRREALKAYEDANASSRKSLSNAQAALSVAKEQLAAWEAAQEAAKAAAEEEGVAAEEEDPDSPPEASREQEQYAEAQSVVSSWEGLVEQAAKRLAEAQETMVHKYVEYRPYWVEGLHDNVQELLAAAEAGLQLRGVIWAHVAYPPEPPAPQVGTDVWAGDGADGKAAADAAAADAAAADSAQAQASAKSPTSKAASGAAGGAKKGKKDAQPEVQEEPKPAGPPIPSALWLALKEASEVAAWEAAAGRLVALEVILPPAPQPEPPPPDENPKGKKPASSGDRKKPQGKKDKQEEEATPPPTPPMDAPGWDELLAVIEGLCTRARTYDEWRARAKVYDASTPEPQLSTAYYETLLDSVPPERVNVAVIMHALLEQVARNAQGADTASAVEQALAEASARTALATALSGLCPDDAKGGFGSEEGFGGGEVAGGSSYGRAEASEFDGLGMVDSSSLVFKPQPPPPSSYTMVVEGDDLGAAAAGLHTGYARPAACAPGKGGVWGLQESGDELLACGASLNSVLPPHAHKPHSGSGRGAPPPPSSGGGGVSGEGHEGGPRVSTGSQRGGSTAPEGAAAAAGAAGTPPLTAAGHAAGVSGSGAADSGGATSGGGEVGGGGSGESGQGQHQGSEQPGDGAAAAAAAAAAAGAAATEGAVGYGAEGAQSSLAAASGPGLPLFVPGRGELDVDAVERHMVGLLRAPGVDRQYISGGAPMDDMARSLRNTALKAHAGNIPLGTVQRCQLLDVFAHMLPESARLAHEGSLLQRRHTRYMPPHILKQVLGHTQLEHPHSAISYYPLEDAALVALFAGGYERKTGPGLPVALTFCKYYTRSVAAAQAATAPPDEGPTDPAAIRHAEQTRAAAEAAAAYEAYHARISGKHKKPHDAHVLFTDAVDGEGGGEEGVGEGNREGEGGRSEAQGESKEGHGAGGGGTKKEGVDNEKARLLAEGIPMPHMAYRVEPALMEKAENGPELRLQYLPSGHVVSTGPAHAPLEISKGDDTLLFTSSDHRGVGGQPEALARARADALDAAGPGGLPTDAASRRSGGWSADASMQAYDGPLLVATRRGGLGPVVSVTHKNRVPPPPPVIGPTPEELEAARQQEEAAAAERAALEAAEKKKKGKPTSGRGAKEVADKKKKDGTQQQTPPATPPPPPPPPPAPPAPPKPPVLAVTVEALNGASLEVTTEGMVLVKAPPSGGPRLLGSYPKHHRGVDVHGAPIAGGDLGRLTPQRPSLQAVTPEGGLVCSYASGGIRVLHADGTVSERQEAMEGWVEPSEFGEPTETPAQGWIRTLPDGTRYMEVDDSAVPVPPPSPSGPSVSELEATGKEAKGKRMGGKGKEEEESASPTNLPPPPPPPRQTQLPSLRSVSVVDPDGGARVLMREDLVLHVSYPDGSTLLQDVDGTRICRAPDGAWSLELEGVPTIHGSKGGIAFCAAPGLKLQYSAPTRSICATFPDGSRILVARSMAVHIPGGEGPAHPLTAKALTAAMQGLASEELDAAEALAASPAVQGAAVFNLVTGSASMRAKSENLLRRLAAEAAEKVQSGHATNEAENDRSNVSGPRNESSGHRAPRSENSQGSLGASKDRSEQLDPAREGSKQNAAVINVEQSAASHPQAQEEPEQPGIAEKRDGCDVWFTIPPDAHGTGPVGMPVLWPKPPKLVTVMYPEAPPQPPAPPPPQRDEDEEEQLDEDGEPIPPPPPPPPLPPDPPVITVHPVAQGCVPRLFVVYGTGDGYEILDQGTFARIEQQAMAQENTTVETQPLTSAPEPGTVLHSFLTQFPLRLPSVPPLPLGATALAQKFDPTATELLPSFRRTSAVLSAAQQHQQQQRARQQQQQQQQPQQQELRTRASVGSLQSGGASNADEGTNKALAPSSRHSSGRRQPPQQQQQQQQQQQHGLNWEGEPCIEADEFPEPLSPVSSQLYMPRVVAHEPPAPQQPPPLPVLQYQEIHELPVIDAEQARTIHEAIAAAEHDAALTAEGHTRVVPHKDVRPSTAQAADGEVVQQILALRREATERVERAQAHVVQQEVEAERARAAALEQAAAEAAAAEAAARKEKRPWPPKVGPFDHTPKRPDPSGPVLSYWAAEEGLVADQTDPYLQPGAQGRQGSQALSSTTASQQPAYATPGVPSSTTPGVYFSPERTQLMQQQQQREQEERFLAEQQQQHHQQQDYIFSAQPAPLPTQNGQDGLGAGMTQAPLGASFTQGAPPGSAGSFRRTLPPMTEYAYPPMGTADGLTQADLPPSTIKSHLYDVYGQPRTLAPPLPRTYKEQQAPTMLNTRHIAMEGDVLRAPGTHTSSGSLLRASGKAGRQFALSPAHIHFGTVPVGSVAHAHARLRNISTGPARFTVDRPALPLRVIHKPGALAAGMETLLTVELVAENVGDFVGEVVVRSELNVLVLSVSAKVADSPTHASGDATAAPLPASAAAALKPPSPATSLSHLGQGGPGSTKPGSAGADQARQSQAGLAHLGGQQQPPPSPSQGRASAQGEREKRESVPVLDESRGLDAVLAQAT